MIGLLRRIRRKLIDERHLQKYSIYALGEILLVVVGILIALQINNWNEARKARQVEKQYLLALKEEFSLNLQEAERVIALCERISVSSAKLANWAGPDYERAVASEREVAQEIATTFAGPPRYLASPGVLNELINSGNLNTLGSPQLRKHIQEWLVYHQEALDEEKELWVHRFDVMKIMNQEMSFRKVLVDVGLIDQLTDVSEVSKFTSDNRAILSDRYFENLLMFYSVVLLQLKDRFYPKLKTNIESILSEIDKRLEVIS